MTFFYPDIILSYCILSPTINPAPEVKLNVFQPIFASATNGPADLTRILGSRFKGDVHY
jgi:hypothetical protein